MPSGAMFFISAASGREHSEKLGEKVDDEFKAQL
jgi:hypothetical protein